MIEMIVAWTALVVFLSFCSLMIGLNVRDALRSSKRTKEHNQFWEIYYSIRRIPDVYDRLLLEWHFRLAQGEDDPGVKPIKKLEE